MTPHHDMWHGMTLTPMLIPAALDPTGEFSNTWITYVRLLPFLESYDPIQHLLIIKCCTFWTSSTGEEYLLVRDQFLWFGTHLPNSLHNPNQLHAFGIPVQDNPFNASRELGMHCDDIFIPFGMMGTVVHFESRAPMDWEIKHLPIIFLTDEQWDLSDDNVFPNPKTREGNKM